VTNDPTALPAKTVLTMATRMGANALHLGDMIGSIEPGKRADLILIDISPLHNLPRFRREPEGIYAQLVYATKSNDVSDVMVNGVWLMRDHQPTTVDESDIVTEVQNYATQIDAFLVKREKSVLSKLVAIGGALEEESFEVQAKVRISDPGIVLDALKSPEIEILYQRHYHEFDTYFLFDDPEQGTLRYREDEFVEDNEQVSRVRYRLTMIGPTRERQYESDVLLSRSRYLAPATHSLRFYREYFKPTSEKFIEKDRQRWRVLFQGTAFYVNLDRVDNPDLGYFLEVKSRTWSRKDAEHKTQIATEFLKFFNASVKEMVPMDYLELATSG